MMQFIPISFLSAFFYFRFQFYSSSLLLIYEGEFVDGSSDSDEEFIHKYRYMHPKMMPDYFNTINQVLEANMQSQKKQKIAVTSDSTFNQNFQLCVFII